MIELSEEDKATIGEFADALVEIGVAMSIAEIDKMLELIQPYSDEMINIRHYLCVAQNKIMCAFEDYLNS